MQSDFENVFASEKGSKLKYPTTVIALKLEYMTEPS